MIERNAQTDCDVAAAAGLHGIVYYNRCLIQDAGSGEGRDFSPTIHIRDAMEAAEKVGLFRRHRCIIWQWGGGWYLIVENTDISIAALTPELAICEAILAIAKANE